MPRVSGLHVYPVKGLRGADLSSSPVLRTGLLHDRRWMLVDTEGKFVSQRSLPQLCTFRPRFEDEGLVVEHEGDALELPLNPTGESLHVEIWRDWVPAVRVGSFADHWFSDRLQANLRLVCMAPETIRPTHPDFTLAGDHVGFADAFPVLVASESSLTDLNTRLEAPLPMNRFRPNIVVEECGAYEEDDWSSFRTNGLRFRAAKTCGRCQVTTTNQDTGEVGKEPLRTLATYRKKENLVYFGAYFVPEGVGTLSVGDQLEVPIS